MLSNKFTTKFVVQLYVVVYNKEFLFQKVLSNFWIYSWTKQSSKMCMTICFQEHILQ